jgi:hypothetical protein
LNPHTLPTYSLPFAVFDPGLNFNYAEGNYDFTSSVSQAYGNNQIIYNGVPSIYNGDVNQDGSIDLTDVISVHNSSSAFLTGNYLINDINGNGGVDLSDLLIVYNNSTNFVSVISP